MEISLRLCVYLYWSYKSASVYYFGCFILTPQDSSLVVFLKGIFRLHLISDMNRIHGIDRLNFVCGLILAGHLNVAVMYPGTRSVN